MFLYLSEKAARHAGPKPYNCGKVVRIWSANAETAAEGR